MFVARTRVIHARKGLAPLIFEAGQSVPEFETWPMACQRAALETGQVMDGAGPAPDPRDPPGIAGAFKRLFLDMRQRAMLAELGPVGLATQAVLQPAQAQVVDVPPTVVAEPAPTGFACDLCDVTSPSERGLKIHRSRAHKGV
jgi:hypothetical protein